jgi:hypothetical protein
MRGEGIFAEQMNKLFELANRKAGINKRWPELSTAHFQRPSLSPQLSLFE